MSSFSSTQYTSFGAILPPICFSEMVPRIQNHRFWLSIPLWKCSACLTPHFFQPSSSEAYLVQSHSIGLPVARNLLCGLCLVVMDSWTLNKHNFTIVTHVSRPWEAVHTDLSADATMASNTFCVSRIRLAMFCSMFSPLSSLKTQQGMNGWMELWATILHCKVIQGWGQLRLMRWILVWIMPQG